jgi:hypothetical protein
MAGVGAPWPPMGSSSERKGKGERGRKWGGMGRGRGHHGGCRRGGSEPTELLVLYYMPNMRNK